MENFFFFFWYNYEERNELVHVLSIIIKYNKGKLGGIK